MRGLLVAEGHHELGGALEQLVARLSPREWQFEVKKMSDPGIRAQHGKGSRLFKRALRWMQFAQENGFDALVLLVDEDGDATRIDELNRAQESERLTLRRALGVAVRTFDAWMLADEVALSKVLEANVPCQPEPEAIKDPKDVFKSLRGKSMVTENLPSLYAALAEIQNLELIAKRCPRGFAQFAERVASL
jgi:Domain of unknown function (DUF4276)